MVPTSSHVYFEPYTEEESFTNFVNRFEIFKVLKHVTHHTSKVYFFLNALTPQLYQKLYDLCVPEQPITNELVTLLKNYLDPQPSTCALQQKFNTQIHG